MHDALWLSLDEQSIVTVMYGTSIGTIMINQSLHMQCIVIAKSSVRKNIISRETEFTRADHCVVKSCNKMSDITAWGLI